MKYIKKFEKKYNYNIGDYILIKKNILIDKYRYGKIIYLYNTENNYEVEFSDGWKDEIPIRFIERLLTPNEIMKYNIEKNTKKYNL